MSTVHETAVARHCGLRVAAVSAITNFAEGMSPEPLSHEQTLRDAQRAARRTSRRCSCGSSRRLGRLSLLSPDLIRVKRDGGELSEEQIRELVTGIADGSVSDAQVGALAMAIVLQRHDAGRADRAHRRDARLGRRARLVGRRPAGPRARQALDRRRRRQGEPAAGADRRRLRRRGADDLGPRPRPHRRHARQARVDPGLRHHPGPRRVPPRRGERGRARSSARPRASRRPTAASTRSATPPAPSSRSR